MKRVPVCVAALVLAFTASAWSADDALIAQGKGVYESKCKACHSVGGVAGPMASLGGALDGIGSRRDEEWLRAYFKDPKSKIPDAKMPVLQMPDGDWDAVTAYVLSLTDPPAAQ